MLADRVDHFLQELARNPLRRITQVRELVDCLATAFKPHMKSPPLSIATVWLLSTQSDDGRVGVDLLRDSETPFLMRDEVSEWLAELVSALWGEPDEVASICIECHADLEPVDRR